jgi:hypothetical protein
MPNLASPVCARPQAKPRAQSQLQPPSLSLALALLLGALWCAATPSQVHAGFTVGADLESDIPVNQNALSTGPGFAIRAGYQLHVPLLVLTPEIGFNLAAFNSDVSDGNARAYRGIAGVRAGIGELLRVGAYGHVGFASVSRTLHAKDLDHTSFTFDIGAFLDLTVIPLLDLGVHIGYASVSGEHDIKALQWVAAGVHAALVF